MTEPGGARARWRAAAVLAPAAAAVFAASTAWALGHDPAAAKEPTTPAGDAQHAGLNAEVAANTKKLAELQKQLDELNAQAAALTGSGPASSASGAGAGSGASSPSASQPAPAPATHATTGASGAVR